MHQLAFIAGRIEDGSDAVDLAQTHGDIVVLSTADNELARLALARRSITDAYPRLRLASIQRLNHPMSVDLYGESGVARAKLAIIPVLRGFGYWPYRGGAGAGICRGRRIPVASPPGSAP